ncbi:hypothetical protein Droror1_Dr00013653 [Drosera rotundifolia]
MIIADLGCSSGPNALTVISEIIEFTCAACQRLNHRVPEFHVFLNHLPGNDFNTLFRMFPSFHKKLKDDANKRGLEVQCFISGVPRSFYARLFPFQFLHFVHSNYSLHWLSQVPKGLVDENGVALNKGNIHIGKNSPTEVPKVFKQQFDKDFILFLSSRSKELVRGGRMVLTLSGSFKSGDPVFLWELLSKALSKMAFEGLIEEEKLDAFDMPVYKPSAEEVRNVIDAEG